MNLKEEDKNEVKILRLLEQRLESSIAPDLKAHLLLDLKNENAKILLDLKAVDYADSSGLGAILFGIRLARDSGSTLKLVNVSHRVLSLIRIAKLDDFIEAYDDEQEALASFA